MKKKIRYKNRNCLRCGLEYSPNSSFQKYCSECGVINEKEKRKKYYQRPEVKKRMREWIENNKERLKEYKRRKKLGLPLLGNGLKKKTCLKCKLEYSPNSSTQKFCSKCGVINEKEKRKKYYQRPEVKKRMRDYHKEYHKEYYQNNKEKMKEYMKKYGEKYRKKPENKERIRKYFKKYRKKPENKERIRKYGEKYREERGIKVISHYSNGSMKCKKCGLSKLGGLSIDHIKGGGNKHLKEIGKGNLYGWLIKNNYPKGFQVLCMSCQFIKKKENGELYRIK